MRVVMRAISLAPQSSAMRWASRSAGARSTRRRVSSRGDAAITHMVASLGRSARSARGKRKRGARRSGLPARISSSGSLLVGGAIRNLSGRSRLFGGFCLNFRKHRDEAFLVTLRGELHVALYEGEQGVVAADAHIPARGELGAALADQDIAGQDLLAAELLDAEALGFGVATGARRTAGFLVSHELLSRTLVFTLRCRQPWPSWPGLSWRAPWFRRRKLPPGPSSEPRPSSARRRRRRVQRRWRAQSATCRRRSPRLRPTPRPELPAQRKPCHGLGRLARPWWSGRPFRPTWPTCRRRPGRCRSSRSRAGGDCGCGGCFVGGSFCCS